MTRAVALPRRTSSGFAMIRGDHSNENLELDGRIHDQLHDIAVRKDHRRQRIRIR
jgi:hypothetical protein